MLYKLTEGDPRKYVIQFADVFHKPPRSYLLYKAPFPPRYLFCCAEVSVGSAVNAPNAVLDTDFGGTLTVTEYMVASVTVHAYPAIVHV